MADLDKLQRHRRQHQRQVLLRARRRRRRPDLLLAQVLPRGVRGAHRAAGAAPSTRPAPPPGPTSPVRRPTRDRHYNSAASGGGQRRCHRKTWSPSPSTASSVSVPKGTLVIRAAELLGIEIPRFCDHPLLDPVGACRQCIVEIEGQRKPVASCTITCTDGMVVTHPAHLAGRREGAARCDGAAADQPPAGLPGLRQGRRVPAAEPGDVGRRARHPASRAASGPTRSRCRSPRRCCWTASGACCARAAPGSATRSPATR